MNVRSPIRVTSPGRKPVKISALATKNIKSKKVVNDKTTNKKVTKIVKVTPKKRTPSKSTPKSSPKSTPKSTPKNTPKSSPKTKKIKTSPKMHPAIEPKIKDVLKSLPAERVYMRNAVQGQIDNDRKHSWHGSSPRNNTERTELLMKCGDQCFMNPEDKKYPVCPALRTTKNQCGVSCLGLKSANQRAKMVAGNAKNTKDRKNSLAIAEKAVSTALQYNCEWAVIEHERMLNAKSPRSRSTSPKSRSTSPKSRSTSPKSRNASPKSRNSSKSKSPSRSSKSESPVKKSTTKIVPIKKSVVKKTKSPAKSPVSRQASPKSKLKNLMRRKTLKGLSATEKRILREEYKKMYVRELKNELASLNMPVSGLKDDLIKKLMDR